MWELGSKDNRNLLLNVLKIYNQCCLLEKKSVAFFSCQDSKRLKAADVPMQYSAHLDG